MIKRIIKQYPSLAIDDNLGLLIHKLQSLPFVFEGWKVARFFGCATKVKEDRSRLFGDMNAFFGKIGRASCRERVEISVGAVSCSKTDKLRKLRSDSCYVGEVR